MMQQSKKRMLRLLPALGAMLLIMAGCQSANRHNIGAGPSCPPDHYMVTASGCYTPVGIPGTQRRAAQARAEENARQKIMEYVGSMPAGAGRTVNDIIARDTQKRVKVQSIVRSADIVDWKVEPARGIVHVWMMIDLNDIRAALAGY
ncbi:MAG: hypothetical protein WCK47_06230 [bacterium]|nr:hypothetical protein [Candidatus Sumerlaeota bacterium]